MKLKDLNYKIEDWDIDLNTEKSIELGEDVGCISFFLTEDKFGTQETFYKVVIRNKTNIKALAAYEDFDYYEKCFSNVKEAKDFIKEKYKNMVERIYSIFSTVIDAIVCLEENTEKNDYKKEILNIMKNEFHASEKDLDLLTEETVTRNFNLKRTPYDVAWAIMQ